MHQHILVKGKFLEFKHKFNILNRYIDKFKFDFVHRHTYVHTYAYIQIRLALFEYKKVQKFI